MAVLLRGLTPAERARRRCGRHRPAARRDARPVQRPGQAVRGLRHRPAPSTAPTSSRATAASSIGDDGTPPPADPVVTTRIGLAAGRGDEHPWRWHVAAAVGLSRPVTRRVDVDGHRRAAVGRARRRAGSASRPDPAGCSHPRAGGSWRTSTTPAEVVLGQRGARLVGREPQHVGHHDEVGGALAHRDRDGATPPPPDSPRRATGPRRTRAGSRRWARRGGRPASRRATSVSSARGAIMPTTPATSFTHRPAAGTPSRLSTALARRRAWPRGTASPAGRPARPRCRAARSRPARCRR